MICILAVVEPIPADAESGNTLWRLVAGCLPFFGCFIGCSVHQKQNPAAGVEDLIMESTSIVVAQFERGYQQVSFGQPPNSNVFKQGRNQSPAQEQLRPAPAALSSIRLFELNIRCGVQWPFRPRSILNPVTEVCPFLVFIVTQSYPSLFASPF